MTARRFFALPLLAVAFAGCGASGDQATDDAAGSNGDNELASADVARVLEAKRAIDSACGGEGGTASRADLTAAVDVLVELTRTSPKKVYETGNEDRAEEMSKVASETSEQLRACGVEDQATRLASVVVKD